MPCTAKCRDLQLSLPTPPCTESFRECTPAEVLHPSAQRFWLPHPADLRRETLFSGVESKQRNWLSESDVAFFTGGGPGEAGGEGVSQEDQQVVQVGAAAPWPGCLLPKGAS